MLEGRIIKFLRGELELVLRELFDIVNKVRMLGDEVLKFSGLFFDKSYLDVLFVGEGDLGYWSDFYGDRLYGDGKEIDLIEEDDDSFGRILGEVVLWD